MTDRLAAQTPWPARRRLVALGAAVLCAAAIAPTPGALAATGSPEDVAASAATGSPAEVAASAATGSPAEVAAGAATGSPSDVALDVSFEPAATVRLRGQRFVAATRAGGSALNEVLARHRVVRVERVFEASEASLDAVRARLIAAGKRDVPDLNRHVRIVTTDRAERDRLLADLRPLAVVDEAIAQPEPAPPPAADYSAQQRYSFAAPVGINVGAAGALGGGRGQNVKIVDVEYAWNRSHEDLAAAAPAATVIANGTPSDPFSDNNHGTAVLGELIATANSFGITGLARGSAIGVANAYSSTTGYTPANAVDLARQSLAPGDVILIEQQTYGIPNSGIDPDSFVPLEYLPSAYDAIKLATQSGINVVEAAGNGGVDIDAAGYGSPFPDGKADSGAIIAGAGAGDCSAPANGRLSFSTYGARVNLQGWGQCVTTTGYGALFNGGANALYTSAFNGTSSASPIVASAAALYSSIFQSVAGRAPTPLAVRKRLIDTGTAQASPASGHIGPLPNLLAATTGFDFTPPTVAFGGGPDGPTSDSTPTFAFTPSEGGTLECSRDGAAFSACTSPVTTPVLPDGAHTFAVKATDTALNPGEPTVRAFTIDTVAPTVTITDGPSGTTTVATPTFSFSANEPGAAFDCRAGTPLAPGAFVGCTSPHTTGALADGASVFEVQATDAAGNTGPVVSQGFTVAVPPPPAALQAPPPPAQPPPPPPPPLPPAAPTIGPGAKMTVSVPAGGFVQLPRPKITCPSLAPGCTVTATARLAGGAKSRIGSATSTIASGKSATVRFRLTSSARARLRRSGTLKATVVIGAKHGVAAATRTVQLTLKRKR